MINFTGLPEKQQSIIKSIQLKINGIDIIFSDLCHEGFPNETRRVRLQFDASANCSGAKLIDNLLQVGAGGNDSLPKDMNDIASSFLVARVTLSPD
jgi:hypothetical protein